MEWFADKYTRKRKILKNTQDHGSATCMVRPHKEGQGKRMWMPTSFQAFSVSKEHRLAQTAQIALFSQITVLFKTTQGRGKVLGSIFW
jgi:hypothetical protein